MKAWLKKHFVPHEGNAHRPHFLRGETMRVVIGTVLAVELIVFVAPVLGHLDAHFSSGGAAVLPAALADLTNQQRTSEHLAPLSDNPLLDQAAQAKAEDMAAKGYFAHTSPDGKTPWYWLDQAGYNYDYAGENLAVDFTDSSDVTQAWMNSPAHRANIEKASYTEVGTGVATGVYEGRTVVFVAQEYAHPRTAAAAAAPAPVQTSPEVSSASAPATSAKTNVLAAESAPTPAKAAALSAPTTQPAVVQTVEIAATSPRHTMNMILLAVLALAVLASGINIFMNSKAPQHDLLTNGLGLIAIVACLFVSNGIMGKKTVSVAPASSASFVEYSAI